MLRILTWAWRVLSGIWHGKGSPTQFDDLLDMRRIIAGMFPIVLAGFILSLVICGRFWAYGAMWCMSCLSVGAAVGFLFGIPKVLQGHTKRIEDLGGEGVPYRQRVNTNLEDISDWLTKIIIGLGLVQLAKLPGWINVIAIRFAASIEKTASQAGVFAAIIVFFLVAGFLFGFLITRIYLQGALGRADIAAAYPDEPKRTTRSGRSDMPAVPSKNLGEDAAQEISVATSEADAGNPSAGT